MQPLIKEDVLTGRGDAVESLAQFPPDAAHLTVRLGALCQSLLRPGGAAGTIHRDGYHLLFDFFLARLGLKPGAWPWSSIPVD